MKLSEIKSLAKRKRFEEALAKCEELLRETPGNRADVLRARAYVFAMAGQYTRAVQDRETIFEMGEGTIRDYFRAADHALSAGEFSKASAWLEKVLRVGEEQKEDWFKAASYFLLAYAMMELEQYQDALKNLEQAVAIEADVAMPLPGICGMCTERQLREEILRRKAH